MQLAFKDMQPEWYLRFRTIIHLNKDYFLGWYVLLGIMFAGNVDSWERKKEKLKKVMWWNTENALCMAKELMMPLLCYWWRLGLGIVDWRLKESKPWFLMSPFRTRFLSLHGCKGCAMINHLDGCVCLYQISQPYMSEVPVIFHHTHSASIYSC